MKRRLGFVVFLFAAQLVLADPSPAPSPSARLDMNFLLLPAHELQAIIAPPKPGAQASTTPSKFSGYRVGDEIVLGASQIAVPTGSSGPLSVAPPSGTPPLNDEGWEVFPKVDPSELRLIAVPLKAGNLTLPSLAIQDSAGKQIARTHPWKIEVESSIKKDDPEPQKPVDLKPPAELAFPWWAIVAMGTFALLVLAAFFYWVYRWSRRDRALSAKPAEPSMPEDEAALAALTQLEKSGALQRGDFKKFYFGVSDILKAYIGARYGFDAPENTTREMMENLKEAWARELGGDPTRLANLQRLFDQLDCVKFTDHNPETAESQQIAAVAQEFVRATRRKPGGPSALR